MAMTTEMLNKDLNNSASDETGNVDGNIEKNVPSEQEVNEAYNKIKSIIENVEKVIIGKHDIVELAILALLVGGHVLIEDVPGVGKTSLVSAVANSVDSKFKRIQFTPDLMPSDVTGFSIFNQQTSKFEFRPGAVMSNIVLADEINRASAKTQASLLEAMEERQVTVDSTTYPLESPFMVLATQNPLESFGTYPLPEAQVDRFLFKLSMGYPELEEERQVIHNGNKEKQNLKAVISKPEVRQLSDTIERVHVSTEMERYIVEIVAATRHFENIVLGSSPRGSMALYQSSKGLALFRGRNYVIPDDVKYLAPHILSHRIMLSQDAKINNQSASSIIDEIVSSIIVPM